MLREAYAEPVGMSRSQLVAGSLKAHRDLARVLLSSRATTETGRELPMHATFLFDVWCAVESLPPIQRLIITRFYIDPEEEIRHGDGHMVAADPDRNATIARAVGLSRSTFVRLKRDALERMEGRLWPEMSNVELPCS